jgi:hypothetical protein
VFTLSEVVPWGRSFDEYRRMFALSDADLRGRVLGCADGPASFNAEATLHGARVVSCDPLYRWTTEEIRSRVEETYPRVLDETRRNASEFVWTTIASVEELGRVRMAAMGSFLRDFTSGRRDGRYVAAALPSLPFASASFDLALCSHFLFLYSAQLSADFHRAAIVEMCRVAREVRVFPLLALDGTVSSYVSPVVTSLGGARYEIRIEKVPYEFQRDGNEMMTVRAATSEQAQPPVSDRPA